MRTGAPARRTVVIATRFGPQPMEAIWEQGGLAVHRNFWQPTIEQPEDEWTITHVRSGFAVRRDLERDEALALAEVLLPCGDWTRDFATTVADSKLYAAVRKAVKGSGWTLPSKRVSDQRREAALAEFSA